VNLDGMYQYRTNDPTKQRSIKREASAHLSSEEDSDAPTKKKTKLSAEALVGQSVCICLNLDYYFVDKFDLIFVVHCLIFSVFSVFTCFLLICLYFSSRL
jgi:hypothetical protein